MAFSAKTNWKLDEIVTPEDLSRIEQGIKDADENKLDKTSNAASASKLVTGRTITLTGGATGTSESFDGTKNISVTVTKLDATKLEGEASINTTGNAATSTKLANKRTISLSGVTATSAEFDGTANVQLNITQVPATLLTGTASVNTTGNAGSATKLQTPRTIALSGGVTGTATSFDGTGNITIPVTAVNPDNLSKAVPVNKGGTGATTITGIIDTLGIALTGAKTISVTTGGNDSTGNGTGSLPFRTINKALSTLPKNLNGKVIIINVGAGSYSETVAIEDFCGGAIVINGSAGANVSVTGLTVKNSVVQLDAINLTVGSAGIFISSNGLLFNASSGITVSGAATGVTLRYGGRLEVSTTLTINNATTAALLVQYNSQASIRTLAGSGNNIGINVLNSIVYCQTNTLSATIATGVVAGHIYT